MWTCEHVNMWTCEHSNICEHFQNGIKMWTHISYIICQMPEPDARCRTERNVTAYICAHIFKCDRNVNMWTCEHVNICEHVQNVIKMWTHISYIICQMPEPDARCQTERNVTAYICVHIFKIVFFRSFGHIQEAAIWPRAIPMDPFEIRVEGYTRYGRPRRSLFSLKSPYLWDSTPDICVHILSRNVTADRNVTAYICLHTW